MAVVGYARVSTADQDLTIQREQLTDMGCVRIFEERESGARGDRPQLAQLLSYVREGDLLVVTKLDRLARSMVHFWSLWQQLDLKRVGLRVLDIPGLDTATSHGQLLIGVLASVAQFERTIIRERQLDGITRAKARGVYKGRMPISAQKQARIKELAALGVPKTKIARQLQVSKSTVYEYL